MHKCLPLDRPQRRPPCVHAFTSCCAAVLLPLAHLSCLSHSSDLPDIAVTHSNLTVMEGANVTVTCNGSGVPLPEVDWTVSGLQSINTHQVRQQSMLGKTTEAVLMFVYVKLYLVCYCICFFYVTFLSIYLSFYLSIYLSVCLSVLISISLLVSLLSSLYLSI